MKLRLPEYEMKRIVCLIVCIFMGTSFAVAEAVSAGSDDLCERIKSNPQILEYVNLIDQIYSNRRTGGYSPLNLDTEDHLIYKWVFDRLSEAYSDISDYDGYLEELYSCAYSLRRTDYIKAFTQRPLSETEDATGWTEPESKRMLDADGNILEVTPEVEIKTYKIQSLLRINIYSSTNRENSGNQAVAVIAATLPNGDKVLANIAAPVLAAWKEELTNKLSSEDARNLEPTNKQADTDIAAEDAQKLAASTVAEQPPQYQQGAEQPSQQDVVPPPQYQQDAEQPSQQDVVPPPQYQQDAEQPSQQDVVPPPQYQQDAEQPSQQDAEQPPQYQQDAEQPSQQDVVPPPQYQQDAEQPPQYQQDVVSPSQQVESTQEKLTRDGEGRDLKITIVIAAIVAFVTMLIAGATNKVVIYFDKRDFFISVMPWVSVFLGWILIFAYHHGGELSLSALSGIQSFIFYASLFTAAVFIFLSIKLSITYNRNVILGLLVGVFKILSALLGAVVVVGQLGTIFSTKTRMKDALVATMVIGFFVWLGDKLINGEKVYRAKGWTLP